MLIEILPARSPMTIARVRGLACLGLVVIAVLSIVGPARAHDTNQAQFWIHPNPGDPKKAADLAQWQNYQAIFTDGGAADWAEARGSATGFSFFISGMDPQFGFPSDFPLKAFKYLAAAGKKIRIEYSGTFANKDCDGTVAPMTARFLRLLYRSARKAGTRIDLLVFDSPWLFATRDSCKISSQAVARALTKLTDNIARLLPGVEFGEIEYFHGDIAPERYGQWFGLYDRYRRKSGHGRPIMRFNVDYDWTLKDDPGPERAVDYLSRLAEAAHRHGRRFGALFSGVNVVVAPEDNYPDNEGWYREVMQEINLVHNAGLQLDDYVIETWLDKPDRALPESEPFTFMNLARDALRVLRS